MMKKEMKIMICIYVIVAVFAYTLSLRIEKLESRDDIRNQNQSIVLRVQ
ncbi:MAG: hypothetical protein PUB18_04330 [bacterium]|nr:hypothetical protein [bacterium]